MTKKTLIKHNTLEKGLQRMRYFYPKMTMQEYEEIINKQQKLIDIAKAYD